MSRALFRTNEDELMSLLDCCLDSCICGVLTGCARPFTLFSLAEESIAEKGGRGVRIDICSTQGRGLLSMFGRIYKLH
jgi:hypothetical protein